MKITKIISCIHLLGCIGWSIFGLVVLIDTLKTTDYGMDKIQIVLLFALFATTASGIYLFAIGRKKQMEIIKNPNAGLLTKIISYIHLLGCIGGSILGLVALIGGLSAGEHMNILVLFAFSALFATTASGIYLFIIRFVIWRQDFVQLWKIKKLIILWAGTFVIVAMCLFPPWVATNYPWVTKGRPVVYASLFSNESHLVHIDFIRLIIQCTIVALITGGLVYTLQDKKTEGDGK
jgi:magnesium-transporting ATPase (P-type)